MRVEIVLDIICSASLLRWAGARALQQDAQRGPLSA